MRRNLLFYLYPVRGSLWAWHLDRLREFKAAFNGRRVVVVSTDSRTEPFSAVRPRLDGLDAELLRVPNDRARGETRHFLRGLGLLESAREDELTFYAHGKGVTHAGLRSLVMQSWSEAMYFMNLSRVELIERILREYAAAGCFRQRRLHGGSPWHYSGTFFWFKHAAVFTRDWRGISRSRYGVEGYLGRHLALRRSFCLTPFRHFSRLYDTIVTRRECRRWMRSLEDSWSVQGAGPGREPAPRALR